MSIWRVGQNYSDADGTVSRAVPIRTSKTPAPCFKVFQRYLYRKGRLANDLTLGAMGLKQIEVPEEVQKSLEEVLGLSADDFEALLHAYTVTGPELRMDKYRAKIKKLVPAHMQSLSGDSVRMLHSMYLAMPTLRLSVLDFARALVAGAKSSGVKARGGWDQATERLVKLLSLEDTIGLSAKAGELMRARINPLCSSRLLSDLRPVFSREGDRVLGVIPVHTLILAVHKVVGHGQLAVDEKHISLDSEDIKQLRDACDRALQKENEMNALADRAHSRWLPGHAEHE